MQSSNHPLNIFQIKPIYLFFFVQIPGDLYYQVSWGVAAHYILQDQIVIKCLNYLPF